MGEFGRDPDPTVPTLGVAAPDPAIEPAPAPAPAPAPVQQPQSQPASEAQQVAAAVGEAVERAQQQQKGPWKNPGLQPNAPSPSIPPSLTDEEEPIPGDLIEVEHGAVFGGRTSSPIGPIKDRGAAAREKRIPVEQLHKEETLQNAWRHLLSGLPTSELVQVELLKRGLDGSYHSCGARRNVDLNEVRDWTQLVPYGTGSSITPQRWILKVAPASARIDDETAYRKFMFERIGPAPPPGWALDSPLALAGMMEIAEDDMAQVTEVVEAVLGTLQKQHGQQQPGYAQPGYAPPGYPPPGYAPPGYAPPGYGPPPGYPMPAWSPYMMPGAMPFASKQEESGTERLMKQINDDAKAREAENRRQTEQRDAETKKLLADAQAQHKAEMELLKTSLAEERREREKAERDAVAAREKAEREARDAAHRIEISALTSMVESLKKDIESTKNRPPEKSGAADFLAFASTLSPLVMSYLSTLQTNAAAERSARAEEARAERDRMLAESERLNKVFTMLGDTQINNAKANAEMIQRLQDPGAMLSMTKLLNETLGGNVQLIATLAKSGLMGGGGGEGAKLNVGELIAQGMQSIGDVMSSFAAMQEKKMEIAASQGIPVSAVSGAFGGSPQMMPPAQPAQPAAAPQPVVIPRAPGQPTAAAAAPAAAGPQPAVPLGTKMLADMVTLLRAAIGREQNPDEVADMIGALVHSVEAYKVGLNLPVVIKFVNDVKQNALEALTTNFQGARPEYLKSIAEAIARKYGNGDEGESDDEPEGEQPPAGNGGSAQPQMPAGMMPAPQPAMAPVIDLQAATAGSTPQPSPAASPAPAPIPMPGKRGRGRPRKSPLVAAAPAAAPAPVPPPAAPAPAAPPPAPAAPAEVPSGS